MNPKHLADRLNEAYQHHASRLQAMQEMVQRLEQAQHVARPDAERVLDEALRGGQALRDIISQAQEFAVTPIITSVDLNGLIQGLLAKLDGLVSELPRTRVERLCQEIERGRPARDFRFDRREASRRKALGALQIALTPTTNPFRDFPGPNSADISWLLWFWTLEQEFQEIVARDLDTTWPEVADFLYEVPQEHWLSEGPPPQVEDVYVLRESSSPPHLEIPSAAMEDAYSQQEPLPTTNLSHNTESIDYLEEEPALQISSSKPVSIDSAASSKRTVMAIQNLESRRAAPQYQTRGSALFLTTLAPIDAAPEGNRAEQSAPSSVGSLGQPAESATVPKANLPRFTRQVSPTIVTSKRVFETETTTHAPSSIVVVAPPHHRPHNPSALDMIPHSSIDLPQTMSFEAFQKQNWLTADNQLQSVPWIDEDFAIRVAIAQRQALDCRDEGLALIFGMAGETMGSSDIASPWLVRWSFEFLRGREGVGDAIVEADAIINDLLHARVIQRPSLWLRGLFCLFGPCASPLQSNTVNDVASLLGLGQESARLAEHWHLAIRRGSPSQTLRQQVRQIPPEDPHKVEGDLNEARQKLVEKVKLNYSAAGGRIEHTHCRDAWTEFMSKAHAVLLEFASDRPLDRIAAQHQIERLRKDATSIFNRYSAKFTDRIKMDRTVREFLDLANEVVRIARRHVELQRAAVDTDDLFPADILEALNAASLNEITAGPDSWVLRWMNDHVQADGNYQPSRVGLQHVLKHPLILEAWGDSTYTEDGLEPERCVDPVRAAARLLEPSLNLDLEALISWLASYRPELLPDDGAISAEIRAVVVRHEQCVDHRLNEVTARLRDTLVQLDQLADVQYAHGVVARETAESFRRDRSAAIRLAWLESTADVLELRCKVLVKLQAQYAKDAGMDAHEVETAIEAGALDVLLQGAGATRPNRQGERKTRFRVTPFRAEAARQWTNPARSLTHPSLTNRETENVQRLVKLWESARHRLGSQPLDDGSDLGLREAFLDVVFERTTRNRKTAAKSYTPRGATHYTLIRSEDVLQWLIADVGNPTFLPQLAQVGNLVVKILPHARGAPSLARKVAQEVHQTDLTILLAPGLETAQREAIRDALPDPNRRLFAIIDDLNLVRILNPGGDQPPLGLALLEIVSEQQPWTRFCPYEVVDGQHVRLEMFVGRRDEANKLVLQASYSRIFSGRRLGKSALLRFAAGHPDFHTLPSGNQLHVVFCPIAGMASEEEVARLVVKRLNEHLQEPELFDGIDDVDRMKVMLLKLIKERPSDSFLMLLDEADTFFDEQVRQDNGHQNTLAWWISRHAEEARDSMGLPRLRFVFCGYLHTDKNRSVWENKGDVLLLGPLSPEDAVHLIAAPLARIGIDAATQVDAIAFRCGYQPAVIVRFGLGLIAHLSQTRSRFAREDIQVTEADVAAVMHRNEVQRALAEACWLNFVGHPVGKLVFAALLLELAERLPNAMLVDLGEIVLHRIRSVDSTFDPQRLYSGEWSDFVHKVARELVDRSLLVQSNAYKPLEFGLRFPHHLPTLLDEDPAQHIRDALGRITGTPTASPTWILSEEVLDNIQFVLGPAGRESGVMAAAVPTHWPEPFLDANAGLVARLSERVACVQVVTTADEVVKYDGNTPTIFVGGTSLTRAALLRETKGFDVDVQRTGRLTQEQIAVWFQRRRAAEFTGLNALSRLMVATGGLPLLVGALDAAISLMGTAPSLGDAELDELFAVLNRQFSALVLRLRPGSGDDALTEEELALLHLVVRASDEFGSDFADAIDANMLDGTDIAFSPTAARSVRLLVALGLLPRASGRKNSGFRDCAGMVASDDVLHRILEQLSI